MDSLNDLCADSCQFFSLDQSQNKPLGLSNRAWAVPASGKHVSPEQLCAPSCDSRSLSSSRPIGNPQISDGRTCTKALTVANSVGRLVRQRQDLSAQGQSCRVGE